MALTDVIPPKGRVYRYKKLLFWAQGGTIVIEDTANEGDVRVVALTEFLERAWTLKRIVTKRDYRYADERRIDEKFVEDAALCGREALKQGDPFDPAVIETLVRHRRKSFVTAGGAVVNLHTASASECPEQAAALPMLPLGKQKS